MNKNFFFILLIILPVVFFVTLSIDSGVTLKNGSNANSSEVSPSSTKTPTAENFANPWRDLGIDRVGPATPPQFKIEDMNGKLVALEDYKGKVIFLNFWATWCPPCIIEMPAMDNLYKQLGGDDFIVVAINDYEPKERVEKFLKDKKYKFKILIDPSGKVSESYRSMILPSTFIINKKGEVVGKAVGMREWDSTESIQLFKELIEEKVTSEGANTKI